MSYDPWQEANEAKELPKTYFGQIELDAYPVVLEKGVRGGVPFDSNYHREEDRRTMVHVSLIPLPSSNRVEPFEYWFLTFAKEWAGVLKPSIAAFNFDPRGISGRYVSYELVGVGTYTSNTGEEKTKHAPKLTQVFNSLQDAESAASELYSGGNNNTKTTDAQTGQATQGGMTKEGAFLFLKAFVHEVGGDLNRLQAKLDANPTIAQFYTVTSPEVVQLVAELGEPEKPF